MRFSVTSTVRQVMGDSDGTVTLLIHNSSGFNFFLCDVPTDNPEVDGYLIPPGTVMAPFEWTGKLYIGTDQSQTNGQSANLNIVKSIKEKVSKV